MIRSGNASPTLAVVAREAGVSVPTASKVANGREGVAPETRRRVAQVMRRLGYARRPPSAARRSAPLVELVADRLDGPWSGAVLRGVEQAAQRAGVGLLVSAAPTGDGLGSARHEWFHLLRGRGPSGVLFSVDALPTAAHDRLVGHGVPFVLIGPALDPPPDAPSVVAADRLGGADAARHLLGLGHRRLAVIDGGARPRRDGARVAGFRSAVEAAGLALPLAYVRHARGDATLARRGAAELLAMAEPPTALFVCSDAACSDAMALGVCAELAGRGVRVPEDVSVVGFGDLSPAPWSFPRLTTVRQPVTEMAARALHLLLRLIDGGPAPDAPTEVPTCLVVRDSTAPPAG
ncbi:LacI family DNA-binding transcriptional regulator [Streptomyces radicis]|uniref:LacI family transcriptional regulator n=1 Tax=Streptomyces radicis TaxID=1750517 RepID=A0A3A9WIQ0_9ACTN|nr:LacI family DNA-binding transcriptional regulator [Streptomyces radicis]RKN12898.1 LacI family transcriptional regulator [Streptomyces radicis]RKN27892.1 LacI family transcriptional regulator [Streptomyces radicis]